MCFVECFVFPLVGLLLCFLSQLIASLFCCVYGLIMQANVPDNSCGASTNNYTFGGIFQKCEIYVKNPNHPNYTPKNEDVEFCKSRTQQNPATGGFSCPQHYEAVTLLEDHEYRTNRFCRYVKKWCSGWRFWSRCSHEVSNGYLMFQALFWCSRS